MVSVSNKFYQCQCQFPAVFLPLDESAAERKLEHSWKLINCSAYHQTLQTLVQTHIHTYIRKFYVYVQIVKKHMQTSAPIGPRK